MRGAEFAIIQTAVTAVLWGTSFPAVLIGLRGGLDPRTFVFLRFALAAPVMLAASSALGRGVVPMLRDRRVWLLGFLNAAGFLAQFVGQQYTAASVAALLINLSIVMAAAGGAIFLGERFGPLKAGGVALAVAGTFLITTNGNLSVVAGGQLLGDGLYLTAAVTWAGYIVYAKKKTDQLRWDPIPLAAGVVTVTAVLLLPAAATADVGAAIGTDSLLATVYMAMFTTALPFFLYQRALRSLTAGTSATVLMLEIVVAVTISVAFLGETLTAFAWIGAACILVSILVASGVEIRGKSLSVTAD
jgi:drug/metabolite transporter (DMT)-like permease